VFQVELQLKSLNLVNVGGAGWLELWLNILCERSSAPEEMESVWLSTTGSAAPRGGFLAILLLSLLLCSTFSSTGTA